jgi:dGTPase
VQESTFAAAAGEPLVRHRADLVVPTATEVEIGVLKGIAAHYVMQADDRVTLMEHQRTLVAELVEALWERGADALDPVFVSDWDDAADDAGRRRVVIDQVASLTDASAVTRHAALTRTSSRG